MAKFQPAADGEHSEYVVPESLDAEIDARFQKSLTEFHNEAAALRNSISNMANARQALMSGVTILEKSFQLVETIVGMIQVRNDQQVGTSPDVHTQGSRRMVLLNLLSGVTTATTPEARLAAIQDAVGRLL